MNLFWSHFIPDKFPEQSRSTPSVARAKAILEDASKSAYLNQSFIPPFG